MTALKIIGIILLIFLLISLLRVGAIVSFGEELRIRVRIGPIKLQILPRRKPKKEKAKKEKKKKEKEEEPKAEKPKKKRKLPKPTIDEIIDLVQTALDALGRMLRRVCRRLRIDPLYLMVILGGSDPALLAQTYGYADAAMWTLMPKAEELFYIPNPSLHLRMDFEAEETKAEGSVGLSLRICDLLAIVLTLAIPLLKWFLRFKRAHREPSKHRGAQPAAAETTSETTEPTEELIA